MVLSGVESAIAHEGTDILPNPGVLSLLDSQNSQVRDEA